MAKKISYKNNLKAVAIFLDAFCFSIEDIEEPSLGSRIRIKNESGQEVGLIVIVKEGIVFRVYPNAMPIAGICKVVKESDIREIQDTENPKIPGWDNGGKYLGWINDIFWYLYVDDSIDNISWRQAEIHVPKDETVVGHGIIQLSKTLDINF